MGIVSLGLWSDVVECLGKVDAKMGTRCTQDGPSRRPRRVMMVPRWPCWPQLGAFGVVLGAFLDHFSVIIWKIVEV